MYSWAASLIKRSMTLVISVLLLIIQLHHFYWRLSQYIQRMNVNLVTRIATLNNLSERLSSWRIRDLSKIGLPCITRLTWKGKHTARCETLKTWRSITMEEDLRGQRTHQYEGPVEFSPRRVFACLCTFVQPHQWLLGISESHSERAVYLWKENIQSWWLSWCLAILPDLH